MDVKGFGVCTWIFGNRSLSNIAERVSRLGYDGVELLGELDSHSISQVKEILRNHRLDVFSLTPQNVDLAHPDSAIREQALHYYLALLDFAAAIGAPMISCHGAVGRVRALDTQEHEWKVLTDGIRVIGERAQRLGLNVGLELLNRYESHLLNTVEQGLRMLDEVALPNVGLHLDTYHMNIEEANLPAAIRSAGQRLVLFHVADSNREGVGRGHTDMHRLIEALAGVRYAGPIVLECTAPGPDPFQAVKDESSVTWVETFLQESLPRLRTLVSAA